MAQLPVSIVTTNTIFWQVLWFSQARNLTERPIFDSRILSEYILFTNYFFDKLNKHQLFRLQFCCKYANIKYWKFRAKLEWGLIGQIWGFSVFLLVQLRAPPVYILISWTGQPLQSYFGLYCKFTITKAAEAKRIEYIERNLLEKSVKRSFCCTLSILQVYFTYLCYITCWALEYHFIENLKLLALEGASRPSSKLVVNMFSLCTS